MVKRILLVEDEFSTQVLFRRMLAQIDPDAMVDCVETAEAAFRVLDDAGVARPAYDLVICDLKLPGSNGLVLWNLCVKKHPGLEFLFVSGVTYEDWWEKTKPYKNGPQLLRKPINEVQLRNYWQSRFMFIGEAAG